MRKLFSLLTLFLLPLYCFSQDEQQLTGKVYNLSSLQPITDASISVNGTDVTKTDKNGTFTTDCFQQAEVTIKALGYRTYHVKVKDCSQPLEIAMSPSATALSQVEVVGLKEAQSITTLSYADLHRFSGLSLQDELNIVPGVQMSSRTPWGGQHIILRGYYPSVDNGRSNSENFAGYGYQLYLNNIPITDAAGVTVMDDIDFSMLGRVAIIKGPSPVYNSYIAGAISMFTPTPEPNKTSIQEQAIAGSYGLFRNNTTIQTSDGKSDVWINYGHQTYNGFRPNDASQKDYVSFAANYNVSSRQTVSTYFSYNHSYEQLAGEIDSADFYGRRAVSDSNYVGNNSHVDLESFRAGVTDVYKFNRHFNNQTTLFATGSKLDQYFAHGFNKNQDMNLGGRTAFNYNGNAGAVGINGLLGAMFQKSNMNAMGNFIPPFVLPPFTQTTVPNSPSASQNYAMSYNIFTQSSFTFPHQYLLTAGGSLNFVEFGTQNLISSTKSLYLANPTLIKVFSPVFTPDISLSKVFNNNISVYGSVSMGYVPPTISQMTNTAGSVNTSLKPEQAIQYEVGSKGNVGAADKLTYQLALFDMDITNRLIQETSNAITATVNAGEQRNMGIELSLGYKIIDNKSAAVSFLRPWISYSYSHFTYVDFKNFTKSSAGGDSLLADYSGKNVAGIAPNIFNAGIDLGTKIGIYLFGTYKYVDKVPVTFNNTTSMKAYSLLSARIGYKRQFGTHISLNVFAGADNLLGSTYYSFLFLGNNIQELAQGNDPYVKNGGGDGYILPAPYNATFYGGLTFKYTF